MMTIEFYKILYIKKFSIIYEILRKRSNSNHVEAKVNKFFCLSTNIFDI